MRARVGNYEINVALPDKPPLSMTDTLSNFGLLWLLTDECDRIHGLRDLLDGFARLKLPDLDRTLGIAGYGRLRTMVGRFIHAFRMNVMTIDPQPITDKWVKQLSLDVLLKRVNLITRIQPV